MSRGFTLIELLMAVMVMSLIAGVTYGVLAVSGEGFLRLQEVRDSQEATGWTGRQLRRDVAMMSESYVPGSRPLRVINDGRGDAYFDQLRLLVREPGRMGITEVYYHIDEQEGVLVRESRLLWGNTEQVPQRMKLGKASSFEVELMQASGGWVRQWDDKSVFLWPKALRIHTRDADGRNAMWLLLTPQALL
ncbi:MAG: prepilin-type N-terminal cleavage/methylation domain-containing protein [Mariprofundaceae bacterium]|nr:prepilin-type N-terminal cleavage/methylation domain-containing protein [Mariprofundaceae bacterium]